MTQAYTDEQIRDWLKYADGVASGRIRLRPETIDALVTTFKYTSPFARQLAEDKFRNDVRVMLSAYLGEYGGEVIEALRLLYEHREQ